MVQGTQILTYRNISAWEEQNFLFFKGLLLTGTSTDLTLVFWEKSNKPKALFSTVREISLFYIKGDLNSEALSHCLKSRSLFKNSNQVSNCCYLTLRIASHWFSNKLDFKVQMWGVHECQEGSRTRTKVLLESLELLTRTVNTIPPSKQCELGFLKKLSLSHADMYVEN